MNKILILLAVMVSIPIHSQEIPLFEEFIMNKPDIRTKNEVYLGDRMLYQSKGSYKPCIIPKVTKITQKRLWSMEYRANEPMCKLKASDRNYRAEYVNFTQNGVSQSFPVRLTGKGNKVTLKYCSLGLCAGKQTYNTSEIEVSDRYYTISPNTFQQSIEYAGKNGNKLNFTYVEFKSGFARDAFTRNFEIDLDQGDVAAFKGAIIKIHSATNVSIVYEVIRNFQSN